LIINQKQYRIIMDKQYKGAIAAGETHPANQIRFRTERLIIRDTTAQDYPFLHKIYTDPVAMRFISSGRYDWTLEEIRNKYARENINYPSGYGLFTIQPAGTPEVIGEAGLFNSFGNPAILELGYILDPRWWGKGYGKEVCRGLIDYCRDRLHVHKVVARMYAANHASVQLSEAVGMSRVEQGTTPDGKEFYRYEMVLS
ncbi:MAG: GNAT family N-acetyltransferase, partial [Tannerellaceae bacterium]|nr:GNAT family N-acetyltransferase [Tannerellaceae bacterium]